MISVHN